MPPPVSTIVTSSCSHATPRAVRVILLTPFLLAMVPVARAADPPASSPSSLFLKTAGTLMVIGGGDIPDRVRARFLELAGGSKARLVVIPTASSRIDSGDISPTYTYWRSQTVGSVEVLHTR